jgi:glycosyltransferase involved in cell wall biosynthesis
VICTYNRAEKLKPALQSIADAEMPDDSSLQLIVVNNHSTDDTEQVTREFSENNSIKLKYLFEAKQGKSHALNAGLKHISGDLIAFTDDDVIVDRGWINAMVNAYKKYPEYKCFGGKVIAEYPESMPEWLDINGSMKFLKSVFVDTDGGNKEIDFSNSPVSRTPGGVNMFFRRNAVEKNGFFRTDLGPIGKDLGFSEDTEYCQRLLEKGERFMYIPSAIVYHPVHAERLKKDYLLKWQYKCGRSEVRRNGGYRDTKKVFGVPRYLFRKFIAHVSGRCLSISEKERFHHKLRLYYTAGEIEEHIRIVFKK